MGIPLLFPAANRLTETVESQEMENSGVCVCAWLRPSTELDVDQSLAGFNCV